MGHLEPLIDSIVYAEGGKFDGSLTNFFIRGNILVHHLDGQIITNILDVEIEGLVPDGLLACSVLDVGLELLLAGADLNIGVHLTESLRVTRQACLDHCQGNSARSCLSHIFKV